MAAFAVGGEADDLCQDGSAAFLSVLHGFKDEGGSALSDHQPVAMNIKRPGSLLWSIIQGGGGEKKIEDNGRRQMKFLSATGNHDVLASELD